MGATKRDAEISAEGRRTSELLPNTDYAVLVVQHSGNYYLRIRELALLVRGPDLRRAYEDLMEQKEEIIDSARAFGMLEDLPEPDRPILLPFDGIPSTTGVFARLRRLWGRAF